MDFPFLFLVSALMIFDSVMNSKTHENIAAGVDNIGEQTTLKASDTITDDVKCDHSQVQLRSPSPLRKKQRVTSDSNYNSGDYGPSLCSHCGHHKVMSTMSPELKAVTEAYPASKTATYRFPPTDETLVKFYLLTKINNADQFTSMIGNVNIYRNHLENIVENYPQANKGNWYVFTPRNRRSADSSIPNRIASCGYWKTTGLVKDIYDYNIFDYGSYGYYNHNYGSKIGTKESLVYYEGNPQNGTKTNWMMDEYVPVGNQQQWFNKEDKMKLDYVLCKIYKEEKGQQDDVNEFAERTKRSKEFWFSDPIRVSTAELVPDLLEKIMIGLDVKDLIRCKSVCKSWYSFITGSRFVKAHLNHSYNDDCNNNDFDHRRIIRDWSPFGITPFIYENGCYVVGSSNGLVCVSPFHAEVFVANPCTREVKILPKPEVPDFTNSSLCWGFGYDSLADDYKVIVGFTKGGNRTCFQVLTLKSNVWKLIGEVNYSSISISSVGILCNGALHWIMNEKNNKKVILSFHLSQDEFKEIPPPDEDYDDDPLYQSCLGIMEECLCIFQRPLDIWIMKNYNVEDSWEYLGHDAEFSNEVVHCLSGVTHNNIPYEKSLCHDTWYCSTWNFINAPIFVQSIVSLHVHRGLKREQQVENIKLVNGNP